MKIVKFRGTMTVTDKFDSIAKYEDDEKKCTTGFFCIAFFCLSPGKCRTFLYDNQVQATVNEVKDGDESYIGIKTVLPNNECPNSYKDVVDFKYVSTAAMPYSWKKVSGVWKFESCKETWKRFERTNGKVMCMKGIELDAGVLKEQAKSECAALGAALTGAASIEESHWMRDQVFSITETYGNVFWIAGERLNPCTLGASWAYKTNLVWEDETMKNEDKAAMIEDNCDISCVSSEGEDELCWAIMNEKEGDKAITDVPCGGAPYIQGAFCAYELYKE